ncbi:MAG: ester cyclase [Ignavibacteriaceae bacterium]
MVRSNLSFLSLIIILLFSVFIYNGCQQQEQRTYTDAELQTIMDSNTQLWNSGDTDIVDALYAEGCIRHNADVGDSEGPEGIKEFVNWVYTAYPDFKVTFDEPFEFKDRIVTHWTATGTNDGPLNENMPATGKKVSFSGIGMSIIDNEKITEEWVYYNQLPIYRQMGYELVLKAEVEE